MTTPIPAPTTKDSIGSRLLFGALGLIALGVATIITLGSAIIGVISIAVAGGLKARRNKQLTRSGAWFFSVAGTAVALMIAVGAMLLIAGPPKKQSAEDRAKARADAEAAMPAWLRQVNQARVQPATADSVAEKLFENSAVMIWMGLMGAVIGSTILGTIAGSFAWGGFMLLYRGIKGRWMPSAAVESPAVAT